MTQEVQNGERLVPFMGVKILLAGSVLAPRAETELLGNAALALLGGMEGAGLLAIDMCCGSGNLCCGLASAAPHVKFLGADLTDDAVAAARLNVERLGLGERVLIRQGDLFAALDGEAAEGRADLIVCNPPYISTGKLEGESAHLLENEPREAFDGGAFGIAIQQRLVREAPAFLKPGGYLLFEFGAGQERQAVSLLNRTGLYELQDFIRDETGLPRVAVARFKGSSA